MENIREYVSKKLFYDDNELFNEKKELFIDDLLDLNKNFAGPLSLSEIMILRKRLGIGCQKESIEDIAKYLNKDERVIRILDHEIVNKVRNYYRIKDKKGYKMSSLDVHPDRDIIYNMALSSFNFERNAIVTIKKHLKEYRIGYLLRYSKIGLNREGLNYRTFDEIVDAVHNMQGKFIDELSPTERLYVIRRHKLESILNSSSEWLVQYSRDLGRIFYPRTIKELIIASEYGLVNKDNLMEIFNKYGIEVEFPYVYKGEDVAVITKKDLLNFPLEGIGFGRQLYHSLTRGRNDDTMLDLVTSDMSFMGELLPEEIDKINEIVNNMGLEFVDQEERNITKK